MTSNSNLQRIQRHQDCGTINTEQLKDMLSHFKCLRNVCINICAINTLPRNTYRHYPQVFIVNVDPLPNPGTHLVCVIFTNGTSVEYFDSLGLPMPDRVKRFINENGDNCVYVRKKLQSHTSDVCGFYVIFFILMRICFRISVQKVFDMLDQDLKKPDPFVTVHMSEILFKE